MSFHIYSVSYSCYMANMENDDCIYCTRPVTAWQQALQCEVCCLWQHRTCYTNISQKQYRDAVACVIEISWICDISRDNTPVETSTNNDHGIIADINNDQLSDQSAPDLSLLDDHRMSFAEPEQHDESSIIEPPPEDIADNTEHELTWTKIENATQRGANQYTARKWTWPHIEIGDQEIIPYYFRIILSVLLDCEIDRPIRTSHLSLFPYPRSGHLWLKNDRQKHEFTCSWRHQRLFTVLAEDNTKPRSKISKPRWSLAW